MLRPEDFGALADGVADDTRALQQALDQAGGNSLLLAGRVYLVSETLYFSSGTVIQAFGSTIRSKADNQPILASQAWHRRDPMRGRTRIQGLTLQGTGRGTHQDGLVLRDFWSEIADVEVVDVGGRGIVLASRDRFGALGDSTMVENRIRRCIVRGSHGTAFDLGEPFNGKLTDGELSDCIASLADTSLAPVVSIGHAAGWSVRNLHTYGGRPSVAVQVFAGYYTRLADLYCEGFTRVGIDLVQVQTDLMAQNIQIVAEAVETDAIFIRVSAHKDFADPTVEFDGICCAYGGRTDVEALKVLDARIQVRGRPFTVTGAGAGRVHAAGAGPAADQVERRHAFTWTGRDPQVLRLASHKVEDAFTEARLVTIAGRSSDGALTTHFVGILHWSHPQPDARSVLVDLVPMGSPSGFKQGPAADFRLDGGLLSLVLNFTPVASGSGQVSVADIG